MSGISRKPTVLRVLHVLILWSPLWLSTTLLFGLLGGSYAFLLKKDQWLASQALIVRDEANGAVMRLGRFESQTHMKAAQETIMEMAKNHQVVSDALKSIGPIPSLVPSLFESEWPTNSDVEWTCNNVISIHAPKGTEFGATEVIYLDVKQQTPERSVELNKALCDALDSRLRQVRKARADSVIAELTHARDAAKQELASITSRLKEMEQKAGVELTDLRGMTDMIAGGTNSRTQLDQLRNELRAVETTFQQQARDLKLLEEAVENPTAFLLAPSDLINNQPGLRKLREGYADAQLNASQLSGRFTESHPLLIAAKTSQASIQQRLIDELQLSIRTKKQDVELTQKQLDRINTILSSTEGKLGVLADSRADYANLVSEVKTRTTILEGAERELAEATASRDASFSTSLITRVDAPTVSDKPLGPGRTTITGLCTIAGLIFGLGLVFVFTPLDGGESFGRRWSDMASGRRSADRPDHTIERRGSAKGIHEGGRANDTNPISAPVAQSTGNTGSVAGESSAVKMEPEATMDPSSNLQSDSQVKSAVELKADLVEVFEESTKPESASLLAAATKLDSTLRNELAGKRNVEAKHGSSVSPEPVAKNSSVASGAPVNKTNKPEHNSVDKKAIVATSEKSSQEPREVLPLSSFKTLAKEGVTFYRNPKLEEQLRDEAYRDLAKKESVEKELDSNAESQDDAKDQDSAQVSETSNAAERRQKPRQAAAPVLAPVFGLRTKA